MTEKERLIGLINAKQVYGIDQDQPRRHDMLLLDNEDLANYLLANGVIVPPVAVGGNVYTLSRGRVKKWKVHFVGLNTMGEIKFHLADEKFLTMLEAWNYDIGKTVFLSREEAEQALERSGG